MQQQRSIGAGAKKCCGGWFSVCADFGLYIAGQCLLWFVLRWNTGGKIQIRVEPEIGRAHV